MKSIASSLHSSLAPIALFTLLSGGAIAALNSSALPAAAGGAQEAAAEKEDGHGEHNELHESMEVLQKNMKAMRKQMRNLDDKATLLGMCADMTAAALTGFLHAPGSPDGLEGSELLAYRADFKKRMLSVAGTLVDMELAIDSGDADAVKTLYRSLGASKKEGHDIYIK